MLVKLITFSLFWVLLAFSISADTFEVKMLNKGESGSMIFEPAFVFAKIGDTVTFVPTDKGHNVESIKGMLPDGVKRFKSKLNKEFTISLEQEGLYGVKCTPHYAMGMIALIQVGNAANLDKVLAVKQIGKAKKRFTRLFAQIQN